MAETGETPTPILDRAKELWFERARVRMMSPDDIDYNSGIWAECVLRAAKEMKDKIDRRR